MVADLNRAKRAVTGQHMSMVVGDTLLFDTADWSL